MAVSRTCDRGDAPGQPDARPATGPALGGAGVLAAGSGQRNGLQHDQTGAWTHPLPRHSLQVAPVQFIPHQ